MSLQMLLTIAVSRWLRQRKEFLAQPRDYLVSHDYVVELPRMGLTTCPHVTDIIIETRVLHIASVTNGHCYECHMSDADRIDNIRNVTNVI